MKMEKIPSLRSQIIIKANDDRELLVAKATD